MTKDEKKVAAERKAYRTGAKRPGPKGFGMPNTPKVTEKSLADELKAQDEWLSGVEADARAAAEAADEDTVEELIEVEDLDPGLDEAPVFGSKFEQPMSFGSVDGKE
jgi:hypothetical protein